MRGRPYLSVEGYPFNPDPLSVPSVQPNLGRNYKVYCILVKKIIVIVNIDKAILCCIIGTNKNISAGLPNHFLFHL